MLKLNASQLRTTKPTQEELETIKRKPIYIILDNVLDTYNIGSIFRLADAVSAAKIYICGESLTPPHTRIKKASVSTWRWVPWEYKKTAVAAIEELRKSQPKAGPPLAENLNVIAVEQSEKSIRFDKFKYEFPLALVVGNETHGVSKAALAQVDHIVELPMFGVNKSLNVMVSCGVILYEVIKENE